MLSLQVQVPPATTEEEKIFSTWQPTQAQVEQ